MKRLRLGVIGCGDISKYVLLFARLNRHIQVVGCADIDFERANRYASWFKGARAYDDYIKMISELDLDAAYLAVPHNLHFPIMKDLIEKNIHILCEKPITISLEEAIYIVDFAESKDVKIGINYQYRYDKACYRLAMAAQKGELGEIYYGICNIPWYRDDSYFKNSSWHKNIESSGGGTLLTQGSHALDILLWACNSKPVKAQGMIKNMKFRDVEVEDLAMGIIELENGTVLQVTSSMAALPEQSVTINLYGSKGTAIYRGPSFPRVKFKSAKVSRHRLNVFGLHALDRSLRAFTRWVLKGDIKYHITGREAISVLSSILSIYESAKTGEVEKVKL
ncbi:MAG: Gfo/Idh/MocA family oxidoreductase [Clostridiales bacterium]|nr:Gfo/Idh/MocA family oxidoreductase [Clostridiales bacterium]